MTGKGITPQLLSQWEQGSLVKGLPTSVTAHQSMESNLAKAGPCHCVCPHSPFPHLPPPHTQIWMPLGQVHKLWIGSPCTRHASLLVNWSYRSRSLVNADQGHPGTQQNQASDRQLAHCPEGTVTLVDPCGV